MNNLENNANKKLWFRARRYGWGWTPITWEGWTAFGTFIAIVIVGSIVLNHKALEFPVNSFQSTMYMKDYLALMFADVLALMLLCYRKGEQPHWSWGKTKITKDENNHHD